MRDAPAHLQKISLFCTLLFFMEAPRPLLAEPTPAAVSSFNSYSHAVEARLAQQHRSAGSFLAIAGGQAEEARLRQGELVVEHLVPTQDAALSGALLHHWRGTAFAPGAHAADFERLMRDFDAYPKEFAPQVLRAGVSVRDGDRIQAWMRVRQRHVITVVMDMGYDIEFGRTDARHGYSLSRSTRVDELDAALHPVAADKEHGFLWRLNTYWSYEERDGGLYLQIEAVSLTRAIPAGLGWALRPYVESVPRESLEFTLRSARSALSR